MVSVPAPPWSSVMPEYEMLPPKKVLADAEVRLMVPVPVRVRLVEVEVSHPPDPASVHVPLPTAIVLTPVAALENDDAAPVNDTL